MGAKRELSHQEAVLQPCGHPSAKVPRAAVPSVITAPNSAVKSNRQLMEASHRLSSPAVNQIPSNALVPLSSMPRSAPPVRMQASGTAPPPAIMGAPGVTNIQLPAPHMMTPQEIQHWRTMFAQNRVDFSVLTDADRVRLSQIHTIVQEHVAYENRLNEYSIQSNMVPQSQPQTRAIPGRTSQVIIRADPEFGGHSFQTVHSPPAVVFPATTNVQSQFMSPNYSNWQGHVQSQTLMAAFSTDQELSRPVSGCHISEIGPVRIGSTTLPSVTSLTRGSTNVITSQQLPRLNESEGAGCSQNSLGISSSTSVKSEVSPISPTCAIIELGASTSSDLKLRVEASPNSNPYSVPPARVTPVVEQRQIEKKVVPKSPSIASTIIDLGLLVQ